MATDSFVEEPLSSAATERPRDGGSSAWVPVTVWQTCTDPVRLVEIRHTDLTVPTEGQARSWAECMNLRAVLHADGRLELLFRNGRTREMAAHDVRIRWPEGDRHSPWPDALMPEGRARPAAAPSAGPGHVTGVEDHATAAWRMDQLAGWCGSAE